MFHVYLCSSLATPQSPRGVLGPFGPKVGNGVENEFQKVRNRVEKESKKLKKSRNFHMLTLFDSVSNFMTSRGNSFSTPFPVLGPEGPKNPSAGMEGSLCSSLSVDLGCRQVCSASGGVGRNQYWSRCSDGGTRLARRTLQNQNSREQKK